MYKIEESKDQELRSKLKDLYEEFDSQILNSFFDSSMGTAFIDDLKNPCLAVISVGNFVFIAGDSNDHTREYFLSLVPSGVCIFVSSSRWMDYLKLKPEIMYSQHLRYIFRKKIDDLNFRQLSHNIQMLDGCYEIKEIDEELLGDVTLPEFIFDQFLSQEDFIKRGMGYILLHRNKLVGIVNSHSVSTNGLEVDIRIHPDHRRKGLATALASTLICSCIEKNIYPNWEADNLKSMNLAKKLGYRFLEERICFLKK